MLARRINLKYVGANTWKRKWIIQWAQYRCSSPCAPSLGSGAVILCAKSHFHFLSLQYICVYVGMGCGTGWRWMHAEFSWRNFLPALKIVNMSSDSELKFTLRFHSLQMNNLWSKRLLSITQRSRVELDSKPMLMSRGSVRIVVLALWTKTCSCLRQ